MRLLDTTSVDLPFSSACFSDKAVHMQAACPELPSFAFQAPEASSAHVKAASSEVFSLGALLFFALTGTPPFPVLEGETREKWIERVVHSEVDIPAYGTPFQPSNVFFTHV